MNIQAYKFETAVLENGVIKIPEFKNHVNEEIEVFIVIKGIQNKNKPTEKKITADEFLYKWAGAFTVSDVDDSKYRYLMEKYK